MTIAELAQVLSEDVIVDVVLDGEEDDCPIFSGEIEELCRYYLALSEQEISSIISITETGTYGVNPHIVIPIEPDGDELEEIREEIGEYGEDY